MTAIHVALLPGALLLALFTFTFLAGSLVHLVSLIKDAVRAIRRPGNVNADVPQPKPAVRTTIPVKHARPKIYVDASAAYARA